MSNRGIVLAISLVVVSIVLVLTGTHLSSLITEKKAADTEKVVLQVLALAEAGANHAQSELRERIRTDLKNRITAIRASSVLQNYVTNNDSLGFLRDYAYETGQPQFEIVGNEARLRLSSLNLNSNVQGNYTSDIIVKANGNPSSPSSDVFIFPYNYLIESQGNITRLTPNVQKDIHLLQGAFTVTCRRDNFARFALFTSHHRTPSGMTVWFTANTNFTGPVSTNERFSFANNPSGSFTEDVTQHLTTARFYNGGRPLLLDADNNSPRDVPIFQKNFLRGQDIINLASSLSQADLKQEALGGTQEPGSFGVFVPNDGNNVIGGIYIRGNQGQSSDDPVIILGKDGNDNPVYTISRGSTTTTVTVDYANNQTRVQDGLTTNIYTGIPDGINNEGILIYTNDDIKSLSGTVARTSQVTVSAERDIVITNNILYQEYNPTPLNAQGYTNLAGILSWGGNVRIGTAAPNNVNIHGVIMAVRGIFTVDNYNRGSPRGTATLLGGAITNFYGPFGTFSGLTQRSGYGRNFVYDARMLQGMAPPYFPYTDTFASFDDGGLDNKLVWQDKGA